MTSYQEYRTHMLEITTLKKKLQLIISKRKLKHAEYRTAYKEHNNLLKEQETITEKIMESIPSDWS